MVALRCAKRDAAQQAAAPRTPAAAKDPGGIASFFPTVRHAAHRPSAAPTTGIQGTTATNPTHAALRETAEAAGGGER